MNAPFMNRHPAIRHTPVNLRTRGESIDQSHPTLRTPHTPRRAIVTNLPSMPRVSGVVNSGVVKVAQMVKGIKDIKGTLRSALASALVAIAAIVVIPSGALAQTTQSAIQIQCYGGQNKLGLYLCACDQTVISGLSALILGGSNPMTGPMSQVECSAWADKMNGVRGSTSGSTGSSAGSSGGSSQPPLLGGRASTPSTMIPALPPPTRPPTVSPPAAYIPSAHGGQAKAAQLPSSAGSCAEVFNQCASLGQPDCVQRYNACEREKLADNREIAVLAGLLDNPTATQWAGVSHQQTGTTDTEASDSEDTKGLRNIRVFNAVPSKDTKAFYGSPASEFKMNPQEFEGRLFNIAPAFSTTLSVDAGGSVWLAGNEQGTAPVTVDNLLVICVDSVCYSAGILPSHLTRSDGTAVRPLGSAQGFTLSPASLNITSLFSPGARASVKIYALDFGVVGNVSDVFLMLEGNVQRQSSRKKLPDIIYEPIDLGIPGNRQGAGSR